MSEKKAAFLHCSQLEQLPYPDGCPFNTSRAGKVRQVISSMGLLGPGNTAEVEPEPADRMMLSIFHNSRYNVNTEFDGEVYNITYGLTE